MLVAIVHNAVAPDAREDERDVLVQAEAVAQALQRLGHTPRRIPVGLDLGAALEALRHFHPQLLFNLVESFAGSDRLASLAVATMEQLGLPMTGSCADILWLSNNKILAKQRMRAAKLPTPPWCEIRNGAGVLEGAEAGAFQAATYILKPVFEHASLGMDQSAVVQPSNLAQLVDLLRQRSSQIGHPCFAEQYIEGREFNISLLAEGDDCEVLPLAETDFSDFPPGTPRIVDYSAKWDESSFAYHHTPRKFMRRESEPDLSSQLARLARQCWFDFGLEGYVRVDFRVDQSGRPWILEINTNPCLSSDAGFAATLQQAGIPLDTAIERIVAAAWRRVAKSDATEQRVEVGQVGKKPLNHRGRPGGGEASRPGGDETGRSGGGEEIAWRFEAQVEDAAAVRELVAATGYFYPDEVAVAEELVTERLARGDSSEYFFVFAERENQVVGYACYGPIACTRDSYDLYWIAVHPHAQRGGLGKMILREAERKVFERGGRRVYIETSNRPQYESTRAFYLRCDYRCEATLHEFYGPGDDKVIYVKTLV